MSRALTRRRDPFHLPVERVALTAPKGVLLGVHGGEHMPRRARRGCVETQPDLIEVTYPRASIGLPPMLLNSAIAYVVSEMLNAKPPTQLFQSQWQRHQLISLPNLQSTVSKHVPD